MINFSQTEVRNLYTQIQEATEAVFHAEVANLEAKQNFERCYGTALLAGELAGKNEAERKAKIFEVLPHEINEVEKADMALKAAKLKLHLLQLEGKYVDRVLRLAEIEAATADPF